jgi:hypothetical protein
MNGIKRELIRRVCLSSRLRICRTACRRLVVDVMVLWKPDRNILHNSAAMKVWIDSAIAGSPTEELYVEGSGNNVKKSQVAILHSPDPMTIDVKPSPLDPTKRAVRGVSSPLRSVPLYYVDESGDRCSEPEPALVVREVVQDTLIDEWEDMAEDHWRAVSSCLQS